MNSINDLGGPYSAGMLRQMWPKIVLTASLAVVVAKSQICMWTKVVDQFLYENEVYDK